MVNVLLSWSPLAPSTTNLFMEYCTKLDTCKVASWILCTMGNGNAYGNYWCCLHFPMTSHQRQIPSKRVVANINLEVHFLSHFHRDKFHVKYLIILTQIHRCVTLWTRFETWRLMPPLLCLMSTTPPGSLLAQWSTSPVLVARLLCPRAVQEWPQSSAASAMAALAGTLFQEIVKMVGRFLYALVHLNLNQVHTCASALQ